MDTKYNIPKSSRIRLSAIIGRQGSLPSSRPMWFAWRREGRVPAPVVLPPRITAYRTEDVHAFLTKMTQASTSR